MPYVFSVRQLSNAHTRFLQGKRNDAPKGLGYEGLRSLAGHDQWGLVVDRKWDERTLE